MAFVGNQQTKVLIPSAAASPVTIPVPQVTDVATNGYSGNMFSHYGVVALGSTGSGINTALTVSPGIVFAINPAMNNVVVNSNATSDLWVVFGKME